jgi:hypothetical protein
MGVSRKRAKILTRIFQHFVCKKFISREVDVAEVKLYGGQNILKQRCVGVSSTLATLTSGFHGSPAR